MTDNVLDILQERGFIAQATDEDALKQEMMEACGRFTVEVSTCPAQGQDMCSIT